MSTSEQTPAAPRPRGKAIPLQIADDGAMYVSEGKIHARAVDGRFQRLRTAAVWLLLGMFYAFPWLTWDGRQAVLFDLPARKFYVFGLNFWPQDFALLALLLIVAGLALFFFTALAGRLWCGYACPQTVWTEVFMWIEHWTEGDRNRRIKLDAAPWNGEKLLRRGGRHALWIAFALWTGFTFVGFFTPIRELAATAPLGWSGWETFWVLFYALATWGNAGFLREQVCKYMCPYARFQSAMFDRNTLIISYDAARGEPRGPRRRGVPSVLTAGTRDPGPGTRETTALRAATASTVADVATRAGSPDDADAVPGPRVPGPESRLLGDCIDCTLCVQVCPTGIDIRNGLQYECIACGACIDACDAVMDKMGYPRGLIRYTTQNAVDGKPTRVLRPRIFVYGGLLLALLAGFAWGVGHRAPLIAEALRDRNALYRTAGDGRIENGYTLKLINKTTRPQRYRIALQAPAGLALREGTLQVDAEAEQVLSLPLTVTATPAVVGRHDIRFVVTAADGDARAEAESTFIGPLP